MAYVYNYIDEYEAAQRFDSIAKCVAAHYNKFDEHIKGYDAEGIQKSFEGLLHLVFELTNDCVVEDNG